MNLAQRIILIIAALGIAAMMIFPPWVFVYDVPREKRVERFAGYHLISAQHDPQDLAQLTYLFSLNPTDDDIRLRYFAIHVDGMRLFVQVSLTLVPTLLIVFILKSRTVLK